MSHRGFILLPLIALFVAGCSTVPTAKVHYTLKEDPGSRPLQQVVLLPVDVDVYEMSAGGIKEEVPEWSSKAETNVRNALLLTKDAGGVCCITRQVDSSSLTPEEQDVVEEHLAFFNTVATNALWTSLPANPAWHFKAEHFDYTLGDGLGFLKTKYDVDAGLILVGEDVVTTAGRKTTAFVGAMFGIAIPLGHSIMMVGLVDFATGDVLWMNHEVSTGGTDLRDPDSSKAMALRLMKDYPGLQSASDNDAEAVN